MTSPSSLGISIVTLKSDCDVSSSYKISLCITLNLLWMFFKPLLLLNQKDPVIYQVVASGILKYMDFGALCVVSTQRYRLFIRLFYKGLFSA